MMVGEQEPFKSLLARVGVSPAVDERGRTRYRVGTEELPGVNGLLTFSLHRDELRVWIPGGWRVTPDGKDDVDAQEYRWADVADAPPTDPRTHPILTVFRRAAELMDVWAPLRREIRGLADDTWHTVVRQILGRASAAVALQLLDAPGRELYRPNLRSLAARTEIRQDPRIRARLLPSRRLPIAARYLMLMEAAPHEVRPGWRILAETAPDKAAAYLEEMGFDPAVGWQPADLEPLFCAGGRSAERATVLLGQLRPHLERPRSSPRR